MSKASDSGCIRRPATEQSEGALPEGALPYKKKAVVIWR